MIKIDFYFDTEHGRFSDALYLEDDHSFTEEQIESLKQANLTEWLEFINTPKF